MAASYPRLDQLLSSINTVNRVTQPRGYLVSPQTQMQLANVYQPDELGASWYAQRDNPKLFYQHYVSPTEAKEDYTTGLQNMSNNGGTSSDCHVYPPLLVRYADSSLPGDQYLPVDVYQNGELHPAQGVPDLTLNFHASTQAITLTSCHVDPQRERDLKIAIWTFYSMHPGPHDRTLTISEFTQMYDQTRFQVLRKMALRGQR